MSAHDLTLEQKIRKMKMEQRDRITPSPEVRAEVIYTHLQKTMPHLSAWDMICFCVEYLGRQAVIHEWLRRPIIHLSHLLYTAHYKIEEINESGIRLKEVVGDETNDATHSDTVETEDAVSPTSSGESV